MGTMADTAIAVVDHLRDAGPPGRLRHRHQLPPVPGRPSSSRPCASARAVAVVERTDEPAAADNPLTREVKAALADAASGRRARCPRVLSVSAGLGSRDVAPGDLVAVFDRLADADGGRAAPYARPRHPPPAGARARRRLDLRPTGAYSLRGHSVGGFGSVTTNKLVATARRRAVRPVRPGLPALRLGEEGPADDLLPDHRRRADPRSTPSSTEVDFVPLYDVNAFSQGNPLARPGGRRHGLRARRR